MDLLMDTLTPKEVTAVEFCKSSYLPLEAKPQYKCTHFGRLVKDFVMLNCNCNGGRAEMQLYTKNSNRKSITLSAPVCHANLMKKIPQLKCLP